MAIAGLAALAAQALAPGKKGGVLGAVAGAVGVGVKEKKRRRRRMLTQADKSDIMFLVSAVGKANAARFASIRIR